jgi:hypothetical protein
MQTIDAARRRLRHEIAQLRPDQARRYPAALRARIMAWVATAKARGLSLAAAGASLGVPPQTLVVWAAEDGRAAMRPGLVPVEVVADRRASTDHAAGADVEAAPGPVLVMPSGVRVVGAGLAEIAALLRALG